MCFHSIKRLNVICAAGTKRPYQLPLPSEGRLCRLPLQHRFVCSGVVRSEKSFQSRRTNLNEDAAGRNGPGDNGAFLVIKTATPTVTLKTTTDNSVAANGVPEAQWLSSYGTLSRKASGLRGCEEAVRAIWSRGTRRKKFPFRVLVLSMSHGEAIVSIHMYWGHWFLTCKCSKHISFAHPSEVQHHFVSS